MAHTAIISTISTESQRGDREYFPRRNENESVQPPAVYCPVLNVICMMYGQNGVEDVYEGS